MILGHYDMILLDVDSKDPGMGMSSPPQQFLADDTLESVKHLLSEMGKDGIINHSKLYEAQTVFSRQIIP